MNGVVAKDNFKPGYDQVQAVISESKLIAWHYEAGNVGLAIKALEEIAAMMIKASTESVEEYDARKSYVDKGKGVNAAVADLRRNFGR